MPCALEPPVMKLYNYCFSPPLPCLQDTPPPTPPPRQEIRQLSRISSRAENNIYVASCWELLCCGYKYACTELYLPAVWTTLRVLIVVIPTTLCFVCGMLRMMHKNYRIYCVQLDHVIWLPIDIAALARRRAPCVGHVMDTPYDTPTGTPRRRPSDLWMKNECSF